LAEFRPEVVHVRIFLTQLSPLILPLLRGIPSILHLSWYRVVCPTGTKLLPDGRDCGSPAGRVCLRSGCLSLRAWIPTMLQLGLVRRDLDVFGRVLTLSESMRARLAAAGFEAAEVLRNAVPERPQRPPLAGLPTVGFAGRLVPEKGIDLLLQAF